MNKVQWTFAPTSYVVSIHIYVHTLKHQEQPHYVSDCYQTRWRLLYCLCFWQSPDWQMDGTLPFKIIRDTQYGLGSRETWFRTTEQWRLCFGQQREGKYGARELRVWNLVCKWVGITLRLLGNIKYQYTMPNFIITVMYFSENFRPFLQHCRKESYWKCHSNYIYIYTYVCVCVCIRMLE
jgi:hypothetical protein